jgi:hypothetical protein
LLTATVRRWSAWAPGLETRESWRAWAGDPAPIRSEGSPEVRFLPPLLRRRCTPLTKIVLAAAFGCCSGEERREVRTVFASRHGSINESIDLIDAVVRGATTSPTKFSHTVHNAQAGLFSIAAGNRRASSSLAAQEDTFACGWVEALTHLEREPERPVLLVMGDVPLAPTFAPLLDEPAASYALALLLSRGGEGAPLRFAPGSERDEARSLRWPEALEFLRWVLSDEESLTLGAARRRWRWERGDAKKREKGELD